MIAIALVMSVPGYEKTVYNAIKSSQGVVRLNHIFGDHDFLLMLKGDSISSLYRYIEDIRKIEGISSVDLVLIGGEGCLEEERMVTVLA
ncbi:MAG: hypothetical protein HPY61_10440 [Methanotrichaceae archaeon]|nr:hypothetical protein [Methanotrichaceae archaeon]